MNTNKNCIHTRIYIHYSFIYSNIGYIHWTTFTKRKYQ